MSEDLAKAVILWENRVKIQCIKGGRGEIPRWFPVFAYLNFLIAMESLLYKLIKYCIKINENVLATLQ